MKRWIALLACLVGLTSADIHTLRKSPGIRRHDFRHIRNRPNRSMKCFRSPVLRCVRPVDAHPSV